MHLREPIIREKRRCVRCILPEDYPGISFREDGVCVFCADHRPISYRGEEALIKRFEPYLQSPYQFNCLVPVSGGKDSIFVLYQMKKRFGMRPLAYNYDNCFTDPQAKNNVLEISSRLGIEVISVKGEKQKAYLRTNLKALRKRESASMVTMLCNGCRYGIIGNAFKIADEHKIPLVLIGWSPVEDTPFKAALLQKDGGSVMMGLLKNLVRNPRYASPSNMAAAAKDYFHNYSHIKGNRSRLLRFLYPGVQLVQFYDFIPYVPAHIQKTVEDEIGWRSPDPQSSWQFDCRIKLLQSYYYDKLLGFTSQVDYLSALVREGLLSRSEALERLQKSGGRGPGKLEHIHRLLEDLDLPEMRDGFC